MTCDAIQNYLTTFIRTVYPPLIIAGLLLLTISLTLIAVWYFKIKIQNKLELVAKWFICYTAVISSLSTIKLYLVLILHYELPSYEGLESLSVHLLSYVFPVLFVLYYAWRKELPLVLRYFVILSYFVLVAGILPLAEVWTFEQIISKPKVCLGLSCSLCDNIGVLSPK